MSAHCLSTTQCHFPQKPHAQEPRWAQQQLSGLCSCVNISSIFSSMSLDCRGHQ